MCSLLQYFYDGSCFPINFHYQVDSLNFVFFHKLLCEFCYRTVSANLEYTAWLLACWNNLIRLEGNVPHLCQSINPRKRNLVNSKVQKEGIRDQVFERGFVCVSINVKVNVVSIRYYFDLIIKQLNMLCKILLAADKHIKSTFWGNTSSSVQYLIKRIKIVKLPIAKLKLCHLTFCDIRITQITKLNIASVDEVC